MKFLDYLGITSERLDEYVCNRLINVGHHKDFPLSIYTYGREAVHKHVWDEVTTKCRGIIVNDETGEIIARPFEKFFNLGTSDRSETQPENFPSDLPFVFEKVDGFLCTMYEYCGQQYVASKGSFHSVHAKWATAELRKKYRSFPPGYTAVFEGVTKNLRIVVDYKDQEGLVLLALIKNETGEELCPTSLRTWANHNGFLTAKEYGLTWQEATEVSLGDTPNFEGYVLCWLRNGQTPLRVKVKYIEYLRLHRMVTGVSPKHIFDVLSNNSWSGEMDEYANSTPWFKDFVSKWKGALEDRYKDLAITADETFTAVRRKLDVPPFGSAFPTRKDWALEFAKTPELAAVLFGTLDGKDVRPILWKLVKPLIKNSRPMVDAYQL